jgi:hypothetical protein
METELAPMCRAVKRFSAAGAFFAGMRAFGIAQGQRAIAGRSIPNV